MGDSAKVMAPPYATFPSFVNFINKLRETTVTSRIDPSVFGKASGSIVYSTLAALKSLKLIEADGTPSQTFHSLVQATDEARKPIWEKIVKAGYPTLFGGSLDLTKATAGQFDEHIRDNYDASGSTVDKVAAFFIAAAQAGGIDLSHHLKARKATAASASAGKSKKQRRTVVEEEEIERRDPPPPPAPEPKALKYQLIDLMERDGIGQEEQTAIWTLVRYLSANSGG